MLTINKEFTFETAHQLEGYNGKCRNIHGHSYRLAVGVRGVPIADPAHPHCGMIMDFADLKRIVEEQVVSVFDHALVLRRGAVLHGALQTADIRIIETDYQPTCENLLLDIVRRVREHLPPNVHLHRATLHETASSWAEWTSEDEA